MDSFLNWLAKLDGKLQGKMEGNKRNLELEEERRKWWKKWDVLSVKRPLKAKVSRLSRGCTEGRTMPAIP